MKGRFNMQKNTYRLTYPQQNIMFVERFNKDSSINVITGLFNIKKDFNEKACQKAINEVIKNNIAMRTKVAEKDGEFSQYFDDYKFEEIEVIDMSSFSKEETLEYIDGIASQSLFALDSKLYSFKILKYSNDSGSILMSIHHVISDAWSCGKIGDQLLNTIENYNRDVKEEEEKPGYIDYINSETEYEKSEKYIKDEEFWKEYLSGLEETISFKDKTTQTSNSADRYSIKLDKEINDKILSFCEENKISPYALFLAAISTYLYRVKDKNDFVLGSPVLNRANFKEKNMLGMFVSTLPLRIKIEENESFLELTKKIGKDTLSVFRHQRHPYMKILEEVHKNSSLKSNLYNIVLSYQNAKTDIIDEEKYSTGWAFSKALEDELQIHIMDMDDTGILNINYDYKIELFEKIEIEYLHTRLLAIIENAMEDKEVNVENIRIMSKEEEHKILYEFNNTKKDYPKDKTVIQLVEEQVEKTPNNVALVFENETMTYKELNEKANILAHYLREERNIKPNDIVAFVLKRGFDMIIVILGVLKAGAAYLPIDPEFPEDRIKYMLEDSNAKVVLYNKDVNEILLKSKKRKNINIISEDEDLAYILYTSGTTGKPKGVMVKNKGLKNIVYYFLNHEVYKNVNSIVSVTTISFDIFVFDSITSLVNGLTITIANEEEQRHPKLLNKLIEKNDIELIQTTPTRMKLLIENINEVPNLSNFKKIVLSGEKFSSRLKNDMLKIGEYEIYNGYGPTENTVFSSFTNCTNEREISIGIPIENTQVYILDRKFRIQPFNVDGELYVSGNNLAKGYINNENLTKESFITWNQKSIYKSGDICRLNFDNKIYCIGRVDHQVKLNGIRIELDEIANAISNFNDIIDNVVIAKEVNGNKILIDYYVSNNNVKEYELNQFLSKFLPKYMLPNKYVRLDKLPTTPNGKVDRKKLELLKVKLYDNKNKDKVNLTEVQKKIKYLICSILNIEEIRVNDNIYEYGMDSLNAIQLSIDISKVFNVDVNIKDLYNCSNILEIERLINKSQEYMYILPSKQEQYPLSSAQFGMFTNYSLNPDNLAYNIPFEMKFGKNIDVDRLRKSLISVINSTDTFFTKINMRNGELYQSFDRNIKYDINILKISESEYENKKQSSIKAFDLLNDVLFNVDIYQTDKNVYVVANIHHIIFDGLSMNIFLEKLKTAYETEKVGQDDISFGQFALYEKNIKMSKKYKEAKEFFYNIFSEELPDNNMILDKKREKEKSFNGNKITFKIDKNYSDKIKIFADENKVTLNSIFLSMFNLVLSKYMYSDDIVIGMATSGRTLKEESDKIGMFVKTIPFRTKLNFEDSIVDYIKSTQKRVLEYIDNSIYTYEELVKDLDLPRNISKNPLFDIMFVYQNTGMPIVKFENEKVELSALTSNTTKFDITCEVIPNNNEFDINIEYSTDLFYEETIHRFASHYINSIKAILENTNNCIKDIDILSKEERDIIINEYNNTKTDYPKDKSIIELFKDQVKLTPNNIAVVFEEGSLTYKELDEKSDKLAYYLYENDVKKGDMIAIMMDKSLELMISILAILKVGAVYVPVELDFPEARIKYILDDTKAKKVLVNTKETVDKIAEYEAINVSLNSDIYNKDVAQLNITTKANDLVYVMYTSGTTGKPKGVMVSNQNVVRLVKNTNYISFQKGDKIIQTGSIAFDATTFEYYFALVNGLSVHLLKKQDLLDMKRFEEYVVSHQITIMFVTTQLFNQIVEYKVELLNRFRVILTGGEAHSIKHINEVKNMCKDLKLFNVYGPTENTTFSSYYEITKTHDKAIPIGKPISNTTCYVLDKTGKLCFTNMQGELSVGGDGVGKGYLNNEELTNQKFITDCFKNENNKIYRTGDLAYIDNEGNINFCGRIDSQVKIRGFRIEPDEINQQLLNYDEIKESVVAVENHNSKKVIVAYYTSNINIPRVKLVSYLKKYLPQYMIPTYFVNLTKIPLNSNGKADKNKLFEIGQEIIKNSLNKSNTEFHYEGEYLKVYELFKEVLQTQNISYDDDFFEIGGDSLLALKLVTNAIAKDIPITYPDLFKHPSIKELGDMLKKTLNEKSICEPMYNFDYSKVNKVLKRNVYSDNIKCKTTIGNILLTGVTGFLGAHILDEFMKVEKGKAYCIIRDKGEKDASVRLKEILNFFFGNKYDDEIGKRICIIEEDIAEVNKFTIDKTVIDNVDCVINSAACVKHFGKYGLFEKVNVDLVKKLIDFCVINDKEFIQVSTLSVSGNLLESGQLDQTNIKPNTVFNENKLYIEQNLDNVYAYTKYLAEKLVYDAIEEKGLKAKVMRMGNLTGRELDGKFQPNVSENAFANRLKTMIQLNVLPTNMLDFYLEFTPIDYAAKAVILLSKTEDKYNTYHLFNHNHAMLYFVDSILNEDLDINLKHITKEEMTSIIEKYSKQKDGFDKIKGIVLDVNKNKELEYVSNIIVKSDFTIKVLEKLGFKWPKITKDYINKYLGYLFDIGFLTKERK